MARHARARLLLAVVAMLAVAAASASASAYARAAAADTDQLLLIGDEDGDVLGLGGRRRRLDDSNATTSIDDAVAGTGFISYAALFRDRVPCSQHGASYYNCRPGAEANPYSAGCSAITRCRG